MALGVPFVRISFWNISGETIPAYAPIKLAGDADQNDDTNVISLRATKWDGGDGMSAVNLDCDVEANGYGECIIPFECVAWGRYTEDDSPEEAFVTEVGPKDDEWEFSTDGGGWLYAGLHDEDGERILVIKLSGSVSFAEGILTSGIAPASNALTGGTKFTFHRLRVDDRSFDPVTLAEDDDDTTGVNRDTNLSANAGAYVVCARVNGELRPIWINDVCSGT